jgi:hypothetical protein
MKFECLAYFQIADEKAYFKFVMMSKTLRNEIIHYQFCIIFINIQNIDVMNK